MTVQYSLLLLLGGEVLNPYPLIFVCTDIDSIQGATSGTMNVRVFDQVVLRCPPPASTPPSAISWLRDSSTVTPTSEGRVAVSLDGDLVISGVQAGDTGRHYHCQATNPVSMVTVTSSTSVLLEYNAGN